MLPKDNVYHYLESERKGGGWKREQTDYLGAGPAHKLSTHFKGRVGQEQKGILVEWGLILFPSVCTANAKMRQGQREAAL